jgi:hypothetical protein
MRAMSKRTRPAKYRLDVLQWFINNLKLASRLIGITRIELRYLYPQKPCDGAAGIVPLGRDFGCQINCIA